MEATPPAGLPSFDGFPGGAAGPTATISPEDLAQFQQGFETIAPAAVTALLIISTGAGDLTAKRCWRP